MMGIWETRLSSSTTSRSTVRSKILATSPSRGAWPVFETFEQRVSVLDDEVWPIFAGLGVG